MVRITEIVDISSDSDNSSDFASTGEVELYAELALDRGFFEPDLRTLLITDFRERNPVRRQASLLPPALCEGDMDPEVSTSGSSAEADAPELVLGARRAPRKCPFLRFFQTAASRREFAETYGVPEDVRVEVGPQSYEELVYPEGELSVPLMAIVEGGVRFPLHPFLRKVLWTLRLTTTQLSINSYRVIMSIARIRERHPDLLFDVPELFEAYYVGQNARSGVYFLASRPKYTELLIEGIPEKDEWTTSFVRVSGNFMFREFELPRRFPLRWDEGDLASGAVAGERVRADIEVVERAYALPVEERSAPFLLNFRPTYRKFLRKKKAATEPVVPDVPQQPLEQPPEQPPVEEEMVRRQPLSLASGRGGSAPSGSSRPPPSSSRAPQSPQRRPPTAGRTPAVGSSSRGGRDKRPISEPEVEDQPLQVRRRRAPSPPSSQGAVAATEEVEPWAPEFLTDGGRRVSHADAVSKDLSVAVALGQGILLPRDVQHAETVASDYLYAKGFQSLIMTMHRLSLLHTRELEASRAAEKEKVRADQEKAKADAERKRAESLSSQLEAVKVALDAADAKTAQAEAKVTETSALVHSLKGELEKMRAERAEAEDALYNEGFEASESAYLAQVQKIKEAEYSRGAHAGYYRAHKLIVAQLKLTEDSPLFNPLRPDPAFLRRPSDDPVVSEAELPLPPPNSEAEVPPPPPTGEGEAAAANISGV